MGRRGLTQREIINEILHRFMTENCNATDGTFSDDESYIKIISYAGSTTITTNLGQPFMQHTEYGKRGKWRKGRRTHRLMLK